MVKKKILTTMSISLLLCGSLSSLQAIGVGEVNHSISTDWFDVHYTYDTNTKLAQYPHATYAKLSPSYIDDNYLPYHIDRVYGRPVGIQFNPDKSGDIRVNHFALKNYNGTIIETEWARENLNDREYAIVPKHRLDWDSEYSVDFSYQEDGTPTYRTEKLDYPIYKIDNHTHTHHVAKDSTYAFYVGDSNVNVDANFQHHGDFSVKRTVDHDTFYAGVTAEVGSNVSATVNGEEHQFHIFTDEIKKLEFTDVDNHSVTLRWDHDKSGEERGYKIYRDGKFLASVSADAEVYRDNHVRAGVTYAYTVKVTNDKI